MSIRWLSLIIMGFLVFNSIAVYIHSELNDVSSADTAEVELNDVSSSDSAEVIDRRQMSTANTTLLRLEKAEIDLGRVPVGEVQTEFEFENSTTDPVKIISVTSSCACTVPEVTSPIAAKHVDSVKVRVKASRPGVRSFAVNLVAGQGEKRQRETLRVLCEFFDQDYMSVRPDRLSLGKLKAGSPVTRRIPLRIFDHDSTPVHVIGVVQSPDWLNLEYSVESESEDTATFLSIDGITPRIFGEFASEVVMKIDHPRVNSIKLSVTASIHGDYRVSPRRIVEVVDSAAPPATRVVLSGFSGGEVSFDTDGTKGGKISVSPLPLSQEDEHQFNVHSEFDPEAKLIRGRIRWEVRPRSGESETLFTSIVLIRK